MISDFRSRHGHRIAGHKRDLGNARKLKAEIIQTQWLVLCGLEAKQGLETIDYGKLEARMKSVGRGVVSRKSRVDEVLQLDLVRMRRAGLLNPQNGRSHVCSWSWGEEPVASIGLSIRTLSQKAAVLTLFYAASPGYAQETRNLSYRVLLTTTPCYYGNARFWFICPLIKNGRACNRRCRILYLPAGAMYFGCRQCYELTYESRQRHRERYYEGLTKPFEALDWGEEKLKRARKLANVVKVMRKIEQASATIDAFCARL